MTAFSTADLAASPPCVRFPRPYNAAVDLIERHLPKRRGHTAFIDDRGRLSYGELAERVNRAGNALKALGLHEEQRVMLLLLDTVDFPVAFLGAIKAGLVAVPVNTLLTTDDYAFMLRDSRARALIVSDQLFDKVRPLLGSLPRLEHVIVAGEGSSHGYPRFDDLLEQASPELAPAETSPDDVAFWLYSSGSTGRPKGALHLHADLAHTAALYGQGVLDLRADDVAFSAAKLFFAYGLGNALTFPLYVGATAMLMAERPTPQSVMARIKRHKPSVFYGVPTLYGAILAEPGAVDPAVGRSLRACVSAGEPLPEELGRRWKERYGVDILDGIGSTELLHIFLSNRPGDVRYGASGKPVPGYEVKIVDEQGRPVKPGEVGDLLVKGPTSAPAYWNNRERSLLTFLGPWTRTGDKYSQDADGYYVYAGRSDDMLKVSGNWVSPFEVESALVAHPAVLEAAVVGHADADKLIKPKAFVVLREGQKADVAELQQFVKARLAPYKYPRWIEFLPELPKTATGKILRFKLRS